MSSVVMPAEWYRQGHLPAICARHGRPATRRIRRTFHTATPPWVLLLILVSLLIAAIVALVIRKSAPGNLPGCEQCGTDRRTVVGAAVAGWVVGLGLMLLAAGSASGALFVLSSLVVLAALVGTFCTDQFRVRGTLRKDLVWLELKGVAPDFAAQIQRALQPYPGAPAVAQPGHAAQTTYSAQTAYPPPTASGHATSATLGTQHAAGARDILPGS